MLGNSFKYCMLLCAVFFSFMGFSQVQFSTAASYLKGSGYYENHSYLLGGGLSLKYVFRDQFLVGITGRKYQANTTAYTLYNTSDKAENLSGTFEMIFQRNRQLKPFLGLDAGISRSSRLIQYVRIPASFFILAPKAGIYYNLGQSTGYFFQLQYNYHGRKQNYYQDMPNIFNPVLLKPIRKYFAMDAGLFIRLYTKERSK